MHKWKYEVDIKQHLGPDTDNEAIVKAAALVAQELNQLPHIEGLDDFIWEFTDIAEGVHDVEDNADLLEHFNYVLNNLYDFADDNRIWMGL